MIVECDLSDLPGLHKANLGVVYMYFFRLWNAYIG